MMLLSDKWDSDIYDVKDVSPDIMSHIVECAYTGSVCITKENVAELLVAADRFLMSYLVNGCCHFLESQLAPESSIDIFTLTQNFQSCSKLHTKAKFYILKHFEDVLRLSKKFLELSPAHLVEFLGRDELSVKHEEMVFEAILCWIYHAPEERKMYMATLLPKVRLGLMAADYFTEKIKLNPLVMENESCTSFVSNATEALFDCSIREPSTLILRKQLTRPRFPPAILLAIGGWSGSSPTSEMGCFDIQVNRWEDVNQVNGRPIAYHGSVVLDGSIYCIGGFDSISYFNTVWKFNPLTQIWHEVANMFEQRCYVSVAVLDGLIYAIGGHNGQTRLNTAERFDPPRNQWTRIASMAELRSDASATTLHGKVYICGGFSGQLCLLTAESYSPQTNQWSLIAPMMNARSGLGIIAYGDLVYAVGGFDGNNRLRTVEAYNPRTNHWRDVDPMIHQRSNFGIEVLDDQMFVVGGFDGSSTCRNVECYDKETSRWNEMRNMLTRRSALSLCVLSGLPEVTQYAADRD
ncbi:kelch-like protein 10 isoform X2 [Triplophysa dalaica]|uniref:kelch-like protein 10 isoform X2 n=1 Tax=Triplophysa dalaica TaxID=1582913 RepID=UPI0024E01564|nr:kelch-like protein 10 isoform X2 [Triplophysa dalaica]XP_056629426.1 kelch-like protein 10 isoform X2 [Triplophysa dalaica]